MLSNNKLTAVSLVINQSGVGTKDEVPMFSPEAKDGKTLENYMRKTFISCGERREEVDSNCFYNR